MEQHPIPRQITSFEFKLIGFMTLRQFIYLVIFMPLAFVIFKIFPIPLLNILLALLCGGIGVALAFVPINERPLDVWVRNFAKRLNSPTQYVYHKSNQPLYFLENLFFVVDPHKIIAQVQTQEKLSFYLNKKQPAGQINQNRQQIHQLVAQPTAALYPNGAKSLSRQAPPVSHQDPAAVAPNLPPTSTSRQPFLLGSVKNNRQIPLPGILIYIKDQAGNVVRLLKTNPHGVFATYNPLMPGEYHFEMKDANGLYFFDTIKIKIEAARSQPFEFYSKELL